MILFSAQHFFTFAKAYNKRILIVVGCCWLLLLCFLYQLPIQKSSTAFFPDNSPALQSMIKAMDMVTFSQNVYVDFCAEDMSLGDLSKYVQEVKNSLDTHILASEDVVPSVTPDSILSFLPMLFDTQLEQELSKRFSNTYVQQSLRNVEAALSGLSTIEALSWMRHDPLALRELILQKLPQEQSLSSTDPRYGFALSEDQKHLLLVLRPQGSIHDTDFALKAMDTLEQALQKLPPSIKTTIVGGIRHTVANTKAIEADILWISVVSLVGIAILYLIFIRSWGGFWLFLTPCLAVSIAFGAVHVFFGLVSGLALGFGMSILGIAEDYAVHMHFALRSTKDKNIVFKALSMPLAQGFLLNASGFLLLLFSAIPAVRQLSAFAMVALGAGFIIALYILPLCPGFDRPYLSEKQTSIHNTCLFPRIALTLSLGLSLGIFCCLLFFALPIDISPQSMGAKMQEIQSESKAFAQTWQLQSPTLLLVDAKTPIHALEKTQYIQQELQKKLPQLHFASLATLLPSKQQMKENLARWHVFVQRNIQPLVANFQKNTQLFDVQEVFAPFFAFLVTPAKVITLEEIQVGPWGELTENFLQEYSNEQSAQSRIIVQGHIRPKDIPQSIAQDIILFTPQKLEEHLRQVFFIEARYIPIMFLLCFALLYMCFKNIGQTCLAAMPALMALFCIFLTLFLWQKPLTLAGLAAMPLVLGLSIDHGIMATHHLAKGIPLEINKAILVSSLTACVSMGMLAFAQHPALQAMGHVIFVGLLVEMPVSIWLLPKLSKPSTDC